MKLTNIQKIAVSKLLLDVMHADDIVTVTETIYYMQMQNKLGITDGQLAQSRNMKEALCFSTIKDMHPNEKEFIASLLHQMIIVDGHVNDEELKVYNRFCAAIGFPFSSNEKAG